MLKMTLNCISLAVFDEFRPGMLEPESDIAFRAYIVQIHYPVEIAWAGFIVFPVTLLLDRKIESFRLCHYRAVHVSFSIAAINVAMLASLAQLMATMS